MINSLVERISALEQQVAALSKTPSKTSKATSKTTSKTSKTKPVSDDSASTTSSSGPVEWNKFKWQVWQDMAAERGVTLADDSEEAKKAFKKAASDAGVTYQMSMKEASIRKHAAEGGDYAETLRKREEAKAKRDAKKVASGETVQKGPGRPKKAAAPAPAPAPKPDFTEKLAEYGLVPKTIGGVLYGVPEDGNDGDAYVVDEEGDAIGEALFYSAEQGTVREV
jgi:hypothetical protein